MSSQRCSLSEELTHIVCSKRHLPGITQCYGWHCVPSVSPAQGPSEHTRSLDAAGSGGECSPPPGRIGAGSATRDAGLESQGFTAAKSFKRYFLFWAIVTSPSGHTYSHSLILNWQRNRQSKEHRRVVFFFKIVYSLG